MDKPAGITVNYAQSGRSKKINEHGMRAMQAKAYKQRGEQYLLIKSPPASGKSRALMFIALDKLRNQGIRKALVVVPEMSIGASFRDTALSEHGFAHDWTVAPKWNLCNAPGGDSQSGAKSKVKAVEAFLGSDDEVLVCTHATFRFAFDELGEAAFDNCLIAIDEFHHVSADPNNRLGNQLRELLARDQTHIVAMTGSYFRGDAIPVLAPEDEVRFETVTYTYYEQLNGYEHLKSLQIGYFFYSGRYTEGLAKVLDSARKTIIHIPNVNSSESHDDKFTQYDQIIQTIGQWQGSDSDTGFDLVKTAKGSVLKVANLVDDEVAKRGKVIASLKDPSQADNRDHVDIIVALGMAKEGFDWIWCEHALTVGYRSSLTEIVQIIGRATRDAPGKTVTRFSNLLREVDTSDEHVAEAVNDTLKAIAASLLMEQVLTPAMIPTPRGIGPKEGFDYGDEGYDPTGRNIGIDQDSGQIHIEINGLAEPQSDEAKRICAEDITELLSSFVQDKHAVEQGVFNEEQAPQELNQIRLGRIIATKYPELDDGDLEAIRQHAVAVFGLTQQARAKAEVADQNTHNAFAFVQGIRRYALDVRELDVDLIDSINPFFTAQAILAKSMDERHLKQLAEVISKKRIKLDIEEVRDLAKRALQFKQQHGRLPKLTSNDPYERRMAEGVVMLQRDAGKL